MVVIIALNLYYSGYTSFANEPTLVMIIPRPMVAHPLTRAKPYILFIKQLEIEKAVYQ
jgi:hypothetical protein